MNLKRCEKGHFYDVDKFGSGCPHCAGGADEGMNATVRFNGIDEQQGVTMPATAAFVESAPRQEYADIPTAQGASTGGSLADFVSNITIPASEASPVEDAGVTQRFTPGNVKGEPVVGWLVCITGEDAGKSFVLKSGRNFIGRANSMDVVLGSDKSVSRDKHAIILYEPRKRAFLAQPGESRELFYVNDDVVLNTLQLNAYDKILIGATELLFVPFCGEFFAWEDLEKED
ncbi:MAG: FHA domain-containing protein [Lachnospiraceae bacterium]|nr:FHA domain-containing protein [Lachnospiraceae bacterium]